MLIVFLLISYAGMAQPGQRSVDPEEMAKRQTEQLKEALGLNAGQEKQVYNLNIETGKKMRALREQAQGSGAEAMREKMGTLRTEQDKKMKEILTETQWNKYEKYREERQSGRGQGRPGEGRPGGGNRPGERR